MQFDPELASLTAFREPVPADIKFVGDSWLRSFRDSPWAGVVGNNDYFDTYHRTIEQLFARGAKLLVACQVNDPAHILGWICTEPVKGGTAVHYLFVKRWYREKGLASELIRRSIADGQERFYTFRTRASQYFPGWRHVPAIARRK